MQSHNTWFGLRSGLVCSCTCTLWMQVCKLHSFEVAIVCFVWIPMCSRIVIFGLRWTIRFLVLHALPNLTLNGCWGFVDNGFFRCPWNLAHPLIILRTPACLCLDSISMHLLCQAKFRMLVLPLYGGSHSDVLSNSLHYWLVLLSNNTWTVSGLVCLSCTNSLWLQILFVWDWCFWS